VNDAGAILHFAVPQFQHLVVVLLRVGGIVAAMPVLGSRTVPPRIKAGFAVALSLALLPIVQAPAMPDDPLKLLAGLGGEFMVGLVMGLGIRAVFAGIELAGELMGVQMGLGMVQLLDPTAAGQVPLVSHFYTLLASMTFLSLNAHFIVVETVADSFRLVAPFGAGVSPFLVDDVLRIVQGLFVAALKLAAPVMAAMLLVNLGISVLGRAVTQMNAFAVSHPITLFIGFLVMGGSLPFAVSLFEQQFVSLEDTIRGLMALLGHG
jgi:flagellar biosynthetic protein FliR